MLKKRERTKSAAVVALLLAPPVAYAAYMATGFLLDNFGGDGLLLHQYEFESRRRLALQIISDGWQAMPVFYAVALLLWIELRLMSQYTAWRGVLPAVMAGVLTGFAVAALFVQMTISAVVPAMASGLLASLVFAWAGKPSPR